MRKWLCAAVVVMLGGGSEVPPPSPETCAAEAAYLLPYIAQEVQAAQAALREDGGRMTAQGRVDVQRSVAMIGRYADSLLASIMQEEICGGAAGIDPTRRPTSDRMMWVVPGPSVNWADDRGGWKRFWPGMEEE